MARGFSIYFYFILVYLRKKKSWLIQRGETDSQYPKISTMFEEKARDLKRETGCFSHNSIIGLKKSNLPHYSYFRMKNSPVVFRGNGLDVCS